MSFTEGADTVALKNSARTLGEAGRGLNDTRRRIDSTLLELLSAWHGPDARDFQRAWRAECEPALARTAQSVGAMVDLLLANIGEQEQASGGGSSAGGASAIGEGTSRDRRQDGHNAEAMLKFADDAYYTHRTKDLPSGWRRIEDPQELRKLGLSPNELNRTDGFKAGVYTNDEGKYVLAFGGTEGLTDAKGWGTNIEQAAGGYPSQYRDAREVGAKLAAVVGAHNLTATGHSEGGGEAAVVVLATGASAYTFNAAGVNDNIRNELARSHPDNAARVNDLVHNYYVEGEPLTASEQAHLGPSAVGAQYGMPAELDAAARQRIHDAAVGGSLAGMVIGGGTGAISFNPLGVIGGAIAGAMSGYDVGSSATTAIELHNTTGVRSSMDAYLKKLDRKG